jgi:beta-lactamase superfamily II metal-dependent hydrolase
MTAHFINIGQGESVLLEFPCGAMLIDAGSAGQRRTNPIDRLLEQVLCP